MAQVSSCQGSAPIMPLTVEHLAVHTKTFPVPDKSRARDKREQSLEPEVVEAGALAEMVSPLEKDCLTIPLLRVSPPIPVGTLPGRYKVRIWKAAVDFPWGLVFSRGSPRGSVIAEDAVHFGIRKGDEVLRINGALVDTVEHCRRQMSGSTAVELLLYHREPASSSSNATTMLMDPTHCSCPGQCVPGTMCYYEPASFGHDVTEIDPYYDALFYPKTSQVSAKRFRMQDMLQTTGRVQKTGTDLIQVHLKRMSVEQQFPFSLRESWQMQGEDNSQASLPVEAVSGTTLVSTTASSSFTSSPVANGADGHTSKRIEEANCNPLHGGGDSSVEESPLLAGGDVEAERPGSGKQQPEEEVEREGAASQAEGAVSREDEGGLAVDMEAKSNTASGVVMVQDSWPWLGLREGDQVVRVNGLPVSDFDHCQELIRECMSLRLELRQPAAMLSEEPLDSVSGHGDFTVPAGFPAHWAKGVVDEDEDGNCCPMPLVQRRIGGISEVEAEERRTNGSPWGTFGWLLHNLGMSPDDHAMPSGSLCFCSGVAEEAEPFSLAPETGEGARTTQSGVTHLNQLSA